MIIIILYYVTLHNIPVMFSCCYCLMYFVNIILSKILEDMPTTGAFLCPSLLAYVYSNSDDVWRCILGSYEHWKVCLCRCGSWSLTLREEHQIQVFENKVLKIIFVTRRYGITDQFKILHNKKLCGFYRSPRIVMVAKSVDFWWAGYYPGWQRPEIHTKFYVETCGNAATWRTKGYEGIIIIMWLWF